MSGTDDAGRLHAAPGERVATYSRKPVVVRTGVGTTGGPQLEDLLGPLECRVLRALWQGAPVAVADVLERVNRSTGAGLAYTTVMTVLGRLYDKALVGRDRQGRGYLYTARYSEPELVDVLSRREVDRVVDRYGDAALSAFVARLEGADPDLLDRLRRLAEGSP